jgi:hypothetical protein
MGRGNFYVWGYSFPHETRCGIGLYCRNPQSHRERSSTGGQFSESPDGHQPAYWINGERDEKNNPLTKGID